MNKPGHGERMVQLHRKYGHIVRVGPNRVSTSDPAAVHITHGTRPVWEKAPSYQPSSPVSGGKAMPSIVAMTDAQSTAVHKVAGGAFTANALLDYEDRVDQSCIAMFSALRERASGEVDLSWWFALFAMDVINRIAFSDSLGFLETGTDVEGLMAAAKDRFDHWGHWSAVPTLDWLLFKSPLTRIWKKQESSPLAAAAQTKLSGREYDAEKQSFSKQQDLMGKFLDGTLKHPGLVSSNEVIGMVQSTIGAGADTTAATLAILFCFLDRHPDVVANMRKELEDASIPGDTPSPPTWEDVRKLPYMDAVIKEALRIFPVAQWGQDRVVPEGGARLAGQQVPAGTVVGIHIDSIQRNAELFGSDADDFNPSRWTSATEERRARMERAMLGFGAGKRICLGMHIAWLEMKKLVPMLITYLDIDLVDHDLNLVEAVKPSGVRYMPPLPARISMRTPISREELISH
ncbi:hypothetical protein LTR37_013863 [Vermiconidia calcicola]|uniref:Uncharacterized protein n=1 Tax=Vermiconidia calcicola TaxID=1690605 RepID=A0ACC3MWI4_9PEZI|nr:hypothetical protein LTR37_013863 [Vermiconidia calcicola]